MTTAIAVWALTYLIHSSVLILLAALVSRLSSSAAFRDVIWKVALVGGIFTASLQSFAPEIPAIRIEAPVASGEAIATISEGAAALTFPIVHRPSPHPSLSTGVMATESAVSFADAAVLLWLLGAALLFVRLVIARGRLRSMLEPRTAVSDQEALAIVEELRVAAGLPFVALRESPVPFSPFASGRGEIYVPQGFFGDLTKSQKRAILAHEVAHLERRDPHWLFLSESLKALFFFQPLNRIAQRQMRDASEFLCDDFAVVMTGMRRELAESLAGIAEAVRESAVPLSAVAEGSSRLVERVARLLSDRRPEVSLKPRFFVAIGVSVAAMMVFLAPVVAAVDRAVPRVAHETFPAAVVAGVDGEPALPVIAPSSATEEGKSEVSDEALQVAATIAGVSLPEAPQAAPGAAVAPVAESAAVAAVVAAKPSAEEAPRSEITAEPAPRASLAGTPRPAIAAAPVHPVSYSAVAAPAASTLQANPSAASINFSDQTPATAPRAVATSAPMIPADAKIAIARFSGCEPPRIEYDSQPARSRNAGTLPGTPVEGAEGMLTSWASFSTPRPLNYARVVDDSHCLKRSAAATREYRRAFGSNVIVIDEPRSTNETKRLASLIAQARRGGADFILDGQVVSEEPVRGVRSGNLTSVLVETRLIRVADGAILETRLDRERGVSRTSTPFRTLARRLVTALKKSS